MKRIILSFLFILLLTSCKARKINNFEVVEYVQVYASNTLSENVELVEVEYTINRPEDVFLLMTIYQNRLPAGYTSMCYSNIGLLSTTVDDNTITYEVDRYVYLVNDFNTFFDCLYQTNLLLYDKNTIIICNNDIITKK